MKKLIIIILGLFLILIINAQNKDSIIMQFKHDFMNIEIIPIDDMRINFDNPALKPALILASTFLINHFIIRHDEKRNNFKYTSRKTGTIFLIGGVACTLTFAFEIKKQKKHYRKFEK